jgi:hypothetical protein
MASTAMILDMHDVVRSFGRANDAIMREDWPAAQQALVDAQQRITHLLGEVGSRKTTRDRIPRGGRGKG